MTAAGGSTKYLRYIVNRNPTNLYRMGAVRPSTGHMFEKNKPRYQYRAELHVGSSHTKGVVRCIDGNVVVEASTAYVWPLAKRLYSNVDVNACRAVGRLLSRQCHRIGLKELDFDTNSEHIEFSSATQKREAFARAFKEAGISLKETKAREYVYSVDTPQFYEHDDRPTPVLS